MEKGKNDRNKYRKCIKKKKNSMKFKEKNKGIEGNKRIDRKNGERIRGKGGYLV